MKGGLQPGCTMVKQFVFVGYTLHLKVLNYLSLKEHLECLQISFQNQDQELRETNVGAIRSAGLPIVWVLGDDSNDFDNIS